MADPVIMIKRYNFDTKHKRLAVSGLIKNNTSCASVSGKFNNEKHISSTVSCFKKSRGYDTLKWTLVFDISSLTTSTPFEVTVEGRNKSGIVLTATIPLTTPNIWQAWGEVLPLHPPADYVVTGDELDDFNPNGFSEAAIIDAWIDVSPSAMEPGVSVPSDSLDDFRFIFFYTTHFFDLRRFDRRDDCKLHIVDTDGDHDYTIHLRP